jgi:RND family efflux transporter MFP subunit
MSRRAVVFALCCTAARIAALPPTRAANAKLTPSVLVTLTRLRYGALAHQVIAYGTVGPSRSGREVIMAPMPAVVGAVNVRLGQAVPRNAPLVRLVPNPQTAAAYARAKSSVAVARHLLASSRKLLAEHLATAQQVTDARQSLTDARAELSALRALGASGAKTLRAPFPAIVTALSASPGALVTAGSPLLDLTAQRGLVLTVGVIPAQAGQITVGDRARVTLIGGHRSVPARVLMCGAMAEAGSGLVPVEIGLPAGPFLPGELGKAAITTREVRGYVVPHAAILINDRGATYVVQAVNGVAREVRVRIADSLGNRNVITGPLLAHAPLVLAGNHQLSNGMHIRLRTHKGPGAAR